jgi:hypothetical protein
VTALAALTPDSGRAETKVRNVDVVAPRARHRMRRIGRAAAAAQKTAPIGDLRITPIDIRPRLFHAGSFERSRRYFFVSFE